MEAWFFAMFFDTQFFEQKTRHLLQPASAEALFCHASLKNRWL